MSDGSGWVRSRSIAVLAATSLALVSWLSGCTTVRNVLGFKQQLALVSQAGRVDGIVRTEHENEGPLVVVLVRESSDGSDAFIPVDTYIRILPGSYAFAVAPGTYKAGAYEDRNRNGKYDPDESVARPLNAESITVGPGDRASQDILIPTDGRIEGLTESIDVFAIIARTPEEQRTFSIWAWTVQGEVCEDLDDERFGPEAAARGLWRIDDYVNEGIAGIYFMEPYDPDRIPVLFVHGIAGFPREFSSLIESLDRERFQAWFYLYPSGFNLGAPPAGGISGHLSELMERLQVKLDFDEIVIVAHSMGGLVARGAILKYYEQTRRDDVRILISISTPWGGDVKATRIDDAPVELPLSFRDMNPESDYQRWIFYRDDEKKIPKHLPPGTQFHLLFGFAKNSSSRYSDDGTVRLSSALRMQAQEQALTLRGYDASHAEILRDEEAVKYVQQLLSERFN